MTSPPLLDLNRLLERCLGNRELACQLLHLFRQHTGPVMEGLKTAAAGSQWVDAKRLAHRLKGSALNLGVDELARLATDAEAAAEAQSYDTLNDAVRAMDTLVLTLIAGTDALIEQLA